MRAENAQFVQDTLHYISRRRGEILYSSVCFVDKYAEQRQAGGKKFLIRLAVVAVGSVALASAAAAERIIAARLALFVNRKALPDKIRGLF